MTEDAAAGPANAGYVDPEPFQVTAQGHDLAFFPRGPDRLQALLELIDTARISVSIAFYIFSRDDTAAQVRDALARAARRGVEVNVILDGFGALAGETFFQPVTEAGGSFRNFMARWSRRYLIRNHQKIVLVDGEVAMLGGFNIEQAYFDPPEINGWNDLAFTVRGPIVQRVAEWFAELSDWVADHDKQFRAIRRKVRKWDPGEAPVELLIGGPSRGLSSWAKSVSRDLMRGQRLDMMMAYFSPSRRLRRRIRRLARRGRARLVLAGKSDNGATIGASRALYRRLLQTGTQIWEFQPCKLHTKLIVIDDTVYLGSANFDMRSLYINLEIVLRIEDSQLAERMRGFIDRHLDASLRITPELHARRATLFNRARWWVCWFLVAVLDYTVSRKLNLGL